MKTCTCPHEATRNGFMRTGYNSLCPFHGRPLPPVVVRPVSGLTELEAKAAPFMAPVVPHCTECGLIHAASAQCDTVDEN